MRSLIALLALVGGGGGCGSSWHGPYSVQEPPGVALEITDVLGPPRSSDGALSACAELDPSRLSILATTTILARVGEPTQPTLWTRSLSARLVAWDGTADPPPPSDATALYNYVCARRRF